MPKPFRRNKTQQRSTSLSHEPYNTNPETYHLTEEDIEKVKNLQNLLQQKTNKLTALLLQNKKLHLQGILQDNTKNKNKKLHRKNKKLHREILKIPRTLHRERSYSSRSDSSKFQTKKYEIQSPPTSTSQNSTNSQYSTSENSQKPKSYDSDTSPDSKQVKQHLRNLRLRYISRFKTLASPIQ